jgi:hypothetical protein
MATQPNEPYAWVILSGLRDFYKQPHLSHTVAELPAVLEGWRRSRVSEWQKVAVDRHFAFNWSQGKVSFMSQGMEGNSAVDGFMLYGTSPLDEKTTYTELCSLCVALAFALGQPFAELHLKGRSFAVTRNDTNKTS